jgi:hypothetical protein
MEQLFGAIPAALKGLGTNAELDEAVVFAAWKRCAGVMLSERTVPVEFFENRLVIAVEDQLWKRHLEELAPQMVAAINSYLTKGAVKFIEYRVTRGRFKADRGPESSTPNRSADAPTSVIHAANNISDPKLRARFLETAAEYLARQKEHK